MRTLCDVCESAAAILFCAADEAALCRACDDKGAGRPLVLVIAMAQELKEELFKFICVTSLRVDMCELDLPSQVKSHVATYVKMHLVCWFISLPFLLIFEKVARILPEPLYVAFFYCEIDGSSLCLQCDMIVHVGGKRTHRRYLLLRQRAEFPGDKPGSLDVPGSVRSNIGQAKREPTHISSLGAKEKQQNDQVSRNPFIGSNGKMENKMIDLNARPQRMHGQASNNQERGDNSVDGNHDTESVVPDGFFKREPENDEVRDTLL